MAAIYRGPPAGINVSGPMYEHITG